nr:retrovirus-related Pol polyprotein from transposon TNT 1-94 [Tanacetum cinerariifolium]
MEAGEKDTLMKKGYNTLIICLGDRGLREVTKETIVEDEDQALMLLTSFPSSYENFMETLLYGREFLTMEDVQIIQVEFILVEVRSLSQGVELVNSSASYVISEGQLRRYCLIKKSSGFVRKGTHDHDSDSFNDERNAYFEEALVVVGNDEMTEIGNRFRWLRRSLISLGTHEKECYTMKMQMDRIKVIKGGSRQVGFKKLGSKQVGFKQLGLKQVRIKQLGLGVETRAHGVQIDKCVWFEVELQGAQGDCEDEVFGVNVADYKKVKESMKANLEKLLKYNAWSARCDDALETLPVDMEAGEKDTLMKKGYNTLIICLGDQEGQLRRYCLIKKSNGFVRKGTHDYDFDSVNDEGNAYFEEALVVVGNDEMTEIGNRFRWLRRSLISLGTHEKECYTVKMQMDRIKKCRELKGIVNMRFSGNDVVVVSQRHLEDKQLEEKINTDYLVKEQEK